MYINNNSDKIASQYAVDASSMRRPVVSNWTFHAIHTFQEFVPVFRDRRHHRQASKWVRAISQKHFLQVNRMTRVTWQWNTLQSNIRTASELHILSKIHRIYMESNNELIDIPQPINRKKNYSPHVIGQVVSIQSSSAQKMSRNFIVICAKDFFKMFLPNFVTRRIGHEQT